MPLVVGGGDGVISLQNLDREHAFSEADVRLLTTLAASLSVALENARLFDETKRLLAETDERAAELALINDVQRGLAENLEMQAMYDLVGDRLREIFDAQVVDIGIVDEAAGLIRFPYTIERGVRLTRTEPIELERVPEASCWRRASRRDQRGHVAERRIEAGRPARDRRRAAEVVRLRAPAVVGGEATGVISLQNLDREHAFSEADERLLSTLGSSLSVALENARLFDETRQRAAELAIVNERRAGAGRAARPRRADRARRRPARARCSSADIVYVALHDDGDRHDRVPLLQRERRASRENRVRCASARA